MELKPLGLIDRAALQHLQSKKRVGAFSHYDIWLEQHAYAFSVAKMMDEDLLRDTQEALADALREGTGFREFKARLKPVLMAKGWWGEAVMIDPLDDEPKLVQLGSTRRLKTIFQTNIATAHAASRWQRVWAARRSMPFLRYNASHAKHKREAHQRYVGLILPVEHALWQVIFPPNGYGCKCSVSALTKRQAEEEGIGGEPDVEMVEFTNPRTGKTVLIPDDITPSFAHNHGDRLGAMDALFGEKNGEEALTAMIAEREAWLDKRY
ncbi:phage minor head protein, partial [uncultured Kingella sp.]|uniref:phage head morphogenesis protein n=1 Tax=uncultured Kingella sp. TaxID=159270 RepID=UPI0025918B23